LLLFVQVKRHGGVQRYGLAIRLLGVLGLQCGLYLINEAIIGAVVKVIGRHKVWCLGSDSGEDNVLFTCLMHFHKLFKLSELTGQRAQLLGVGSVQGAGSSFYGAEFCAKGVVDKSDGVKGSWRGDAPLGVFKIYTSKTG